MKRAILFVAILLAMVFAEPVVAENSSKEIVEGFVNAIRNRDGTLAKTYLHSSLHERIPYPQIGNETALSDIEIENYGKDVFIIKGYIGPYSNQYPKHVVFIWEAKVERSKITEIIILHDYTYGAWLKQSKSKVVVASVPSEKDNEDPIYLLAEKRSGMDFQNFTVQIGDKRGQEIFNFPNWKHIKHEPGLYYQDVSEDKRKDVVVVLKTVAGTGFSEEDIYVLNQVTDPYHNHKEVPIESSLDAFWRLVRIEEVKRKLIVKVDTQTFEVPTPNAVVPIPNWYLTQYYKVENNEIVSDVGLKVWGEGGIATFIMKYGWDGKEYKVKSIEFKS